MAVKFPLSLFVMLLLATSAFAATDQTVPTVLRDNAAVQDTIRPQPNNRPAPTVYTYTARDRVVLELTFNTAANQRQVFPNFTIQIQRGRQILFDYHLDANLANYLFFPVLEKGVYQIVVRGPAVGTPYTLQIRPLKVEVTEQDKTAALAAIEKGTANLLSATPAKSGDPGLLAIAIEALVMDALASDRSGANYEAIEKDYLPWFQTMLQDFPTAQWNGQSVSGFTRSNQPMYSHAIATLALAEMAPHSPKAKALAEKGANFLLAAQISDKRPAVWRPLPKTNPSYGGWRYAANAADADLSVSGWCIIALNACAVADIQPDGMRDALKDGVAFVKRTAVRDGFGYAAGGALGAGTIRNAIGSLVYTLYGEHGRESEAANAFIDQHLFAGTQADDSQDYPLYYAYYATRLNYLRGSTAWEAWRMSAIRQLVKLQKSDGSWPTARLETQTGPHRYATALSILILRMCLNDEPTYMTQEVRGF